MIHAEEVTKRYGPVLAVDRLSFDVEPGETFAIVGPNGAGKTTTLKILLGLVRPNAGRVEIGARRLPPRDTAARHAVGYVPQRAEFPVARTAEEILRFFADLRGLPRDAVARALARTDLTALATRRSGELSGGYIQRLALAQALLGDPALLILDEPTASLDPQATWEFRSLVEQLRAEGKTIVLCSHLLSEVERIADRVLILVAGRRAALERLADLRARQVMSTRLAVEVDGARDLAESALRARGLPFVSRNGKGLAIEAEQGRFGDVLDGLRGAGVHVRNVEVVRPTLEELFLEVVHREDA